MRAVVRHSYRWKAAVGVGVTGVVAAAVALSRPTNSQQDAPVSRQQNLPVWPKDSREEWAYPSPYHATDTEGHVGPDAFVPHLERRFLDHSKKYWRLKALVDYWQTLEEEECWPWVWCQPNPMGPHHVFVGADETLLERCRSVTAASPRNNITIIVPKEECLQRHAPLDQYFKVGAAVIEGEVAQFDAPDRVLMMTDERIVCFDKCYLL